MVDGGGGRDVRDQHPRALGKPPPRPHPRYCRRGCTKGIHEVVTGQFFL